MKDYLKFKTSGTVKIVKIGEGKVIQCAKWDADTGQPAASKMVIVDETALLAEKAELAARISEIDMLLADAKKVK